MSGKVEKLYFEWPDGSHESRKMPAPVDKETAGELILGAYGKAKVKPAEIIGWDADGIAVIACDASSGSPVLVDCQ